MQNETDNLNRNYSSEFTKSSNDKSLVNDYNNTYNLLMNVIENSPEHLGKISSEFDGYNLAVANYNEEDQDLEFEQYLTKNGYENIYDKYSDDVIKDVNAYRDLNEKLLSIDNQYRVNNAEGLYKLSEIHQVEDTKEYIKHNYDFVKDLKIEDIGQNHSVISFDSFDVQQERKVVENNGESIKDITKETLEKQYNEYKNEINTLIEQSPEILKKVENDIEAYSLKDDLEGLHQKYSDDVIKDAEKYSKLELKLLDTDYEFHRQFDSFLHDNNGLKNIEETKQYIQNNYTNISDLKIERDKENDIVLSFKSDNEQHLVVNNGDTIQPKEELQKLKSVELEKNVIGLLPKEEQQNHYKEPLSRLEKIKSSLKNELKNYMNNPKIENTINSIKQHFENVKVKSVDLQQTFKDLGQWNTENKFVKNIDNVINSVKELGRKHENELLNSDTNSIMTKLNNEYLELKEFVNTAEKDSYNFKKENEIRNDFTSKMLDSKQINIDFDPKEITSNLSENEKLEVYNQLKDLNLHYQNNADTASIIKLRDNNEIINQIEKDNPEFKEYRQEHLNLKQSLKPIKLDISNEKLDDMIQQSNKDINNMKGFDKSKFKENRMQETKVVNQNAQANKIKNNDMFQKMEKLNNEVKNERNQNQTETRSLTKNKDSMTR